MSALQTLLDSLSFEGLDHLTCFPRSHNPGLLREGKMDENGGGPDMVRDRLQGGSGEPLLSSERCETVRFALLFPLYDNPSFC